MGSLQASGVGGETLLVGSNDPHTTPHLPLLFSLTGKRKATRFRINRIKVTPHP